jgi:hypothetical protein
MDISGLTRDRHTNERTNPDRTDRTELTLTELDQTTTMSASGPSMMYATQRPAFEARKVLLDASFKSPSTPTSPPEYDPIDVLALCALKKSVVSHLPTHCIHCGAEYPQGSIVELSDGTVMAYCKCKGACGKSHVLFAGVDVSTPIFEKTCPFKSIVVEVDATADLTAVGPPSAQELARLVTELQHRVITIEDHDPTCALCGKRHLSHKQDCDVNGWRIASRRRVALPSDWPVFQPSTATWKPSA